MYSMPSELPRAHVRQTTRQEGLLVIERDPSGMPSLPW